MWFSIGAFTVKSDNNRLTNRQFMRSHFSLPVYLYEFGFLHDFSTNLFVSKNDIENDSPKMCFWLLMLRATQNSSRLWYIQHDCGLIAYSFRSTKKLPFNSGILCKLFGASMDPWETIYLSNYIWLIYFHFMHDAISQLSFGDVFETWKKN